MPKIRCHYLDCAFLDDNYCTAALVELNPDEGCLTYSPTSEPTHEDEWDDSELEDWEDTEEESDEDDDDDWGDDEEDEF